MELKGIVDNKTLIIEYYSNRVNSYRLNSGYVSCHGLKFITFGENWCRTFFCKKKFMEEM